MVINHVGIIPDGNRRYAKSKGLKTWEGHRIGLKRVREIIETSLELGINNLTIYTFSIENFKRDKVEIKFLFKLFKKTFQKINFNEFIDKGIKVRFAGDKSFFSREMQQIMNKVEDKTKKCSKLTVNLAMGYGGRLEIINAIKKIVEKEKKPKDIDENLFKDNLYVKEDIDLIIRTSGEKRISGFFPWQSAYSEFMFIDKYWPDFTKEDFIKCINAFLERKRRFGQ